MSDQPAAPDPETLSSIHGLELHARRVVEGYLAGLHKSPYHGFAVEFAQHREYVPGDDVKHIDWKVFGRTERYYLKQYEQDTNFVCWLLVDVSESMGYGSGRLSKHAHAALAAAALAYLVVQQADAIGLATFDAGVRQFLRPASQMTHFREVTRRLVQPPGVEKTGLGRTLHELAERISRRGLVFLFSDLFDEVPDLLAGLRHLRFDGHEVVVFHVLDAAELDFPFTDATLFRGLEQAGELLTDPRGLRAGYLQELNAFLDAVKSGCRAQEVDYVLLRTDADLGAVLSRYLAHRATRRT
jgi:uncharacterized protein (DUF58 family)